MKKKVAAYARVSTNSKNQEHSFAFQSAYWNETLSSNEEYDYIGLFADKGITGKYAKRRPQFMALLSEAEKGNIDIIYTKSVQRFARNTEELLNIVKRLREKGIAVIFEKEHINSLNTDSELYLTIAAALAEEDLNNYSTNIKWTIQDKFKQGENVMGYIIYGYDVVGNSKLVVNEEQAKVVRNIFEMYSTGEYSVSKIAKYLNELNIPSSRGVKWDDSTIRSMLKNEKYIGDLLLQKYYSEKGIRHKNIGQRDMYYVEGDHEAIISKELWNKVQDVIDKRGNKKLLGQTQKIYPFTSIIECGICGSHYQHKIANSGTPCSTAYYACSVSRKKGKSVCNNHDIKEEVLNNLFVESFNEFIDNKYISDECENYKEELVKKCKEEKELNQLRAQGWITKENYEIEHNEIRKTINELEREIDNISSLHINPSSFKKLECFDEDVLHKVIKKVTIQNWVVAFEFYNGCIIKKKYNNGPRGNKEIWKLAPIRGGK